MEEIMDSTAVHGFSPYAQTFDEFLQSPRLFLPKPEFLTATYGEDDTALTYAIRQQNIDGILVLMMSGVDPNAFNRKGATPISIAAHKGSSKIIRVLIEAGANVNALNSTGSTALIQASHFGFVDSVIILLENGATSDFANSKGTTALMRASQEGHLDICKVLIRHSADVNRKNNEGMNALMLASQRGHSDMVALLIRAGAAMDEQTVQGSTALMLACKRGHENCVKTLVTMGAEIFIRDARLRTARDTAHRRNHFHLIPLLDTQLQMRDMAEWRREFRNKHLASMKQMFHNGKLELKSEERDQITLLESYYVENPVDQVIVGHWPDSLRKPQPNVMGWQWCKLLFRVMDLPFGVFELIVEFMPSPRVWQWSIWRLTERAKLAPHQSLKDIGYIMDEILADSNIFVGSDQTNLLVRINRNPEIHPYLIKYWEMDSNLIDLICCWADVQSLAARTTDTEITFKHKLARDMLRAAACLLKWFRARHVSKNAIETIPELIALFPDPKKGHDENDMVEATDATGDELSDGDNELENDANETETELDMVIDTGADNEIHNNVPEYDYGEDSDADTEMVVYIP